MKHNPSQREDVGGKHQYRQLNHEQNSTQIYVFKTYCLENKQAFFNRDSRFSTAIVGVFHQQSQQSEEKAHIKYQMQIQTAKPLLVFSTNNPSRVRRKLS
ncbi:hypothetical protein ESY86_19395 [Subsaximicrobium wynnwilliamsii]|uniref:Uncharacterized protein n=1 Tax=Subsaximicrobium wynnwilliamsii TaxID=291179 RepID=A0A5C6ZBQ5_9FLAO|nr:hypothetical protein [Subsaximicrobium wynnwilliamsii]TXD81099.1 hypothetical protein ESY87_19420 [Subsaximicrobium wynnwilliamsii]TXD86773.1 hypothetical protein ESY86_19395 [Subsaximicrobium wynnwilliamsii]TXE00402.1 hypothetical protein ESY88_19485 [Subsaximicrobium wynnwilliamsii]